MRVDNGESRTIDVGGDAVQPHWSPHGYRIAFWSHALSERNYRDIWTVPAEGGEIVPVTRDEHIDWNPVWSPDGEYLYFCSSRGGTMSLWRVAIEEETGIVGGAPEVITASPGARLGLVSIAGDGLRITYRADVSTSNLHKISFDPESEAVVGDPVAITRGTRPATHPDVSPDGKRLAPSRTWQRPCEAPGACRSRSEPSTRSGRSNASTHSAPSSSEAAKRRLPNLPRWSRWRPRGAR